MLLIKEDIACSIDHIQICNSSIYLQCEICNDRESQRHRLSLLPLLVILLSLALSGCKIRKQTITKKKITTKQNNNNVLVTKSYMTLDIQIDE